MGQGQSTTSFDLRKPETNAVVVTNNSEGKASSSGRDPRSPRLWRDYVAPKAILVTGARGAFACYINALFLAVEDTLYNGKTLYQSYANPDQWLRYTPSSRWAVGNTRDKDENDVAGTCCCNAGGLMDPSLASVWYVGAADGTFDIQYEVKARSLSDIEALKLKQQLALKREEASKANLKAAGGIRIHGACGPRADLINGFYIESTEKHLSRKMWIRHGQAADENQLFTWLRYDGSGRWILGKFAGRGKSIDLLGYCFETECSDPTRAKTWHVSNGNGGCRLQETVRVEGVKKDTHDDMFEFEVTCLDATGSSTTPRQASPFIASGKSLKRAFEKPAFTEDNKSNSQQAVNSTNLTNHKRRHRYTPSCETICEKKYAKNMKKNPIGLEVPRSRSSPAAFRGMVGRNPSLSLVLHLNRRKHSKRLSSRIFPDPVFQ